MAARAVVRGLPRRAWKRVETSAAAVGADGGTADRETDAPAIDDARKRAARGLVRLASWNVLADGLAQETDFTYCATEVLSWSARRPAVLDGIRQVAADIVCLQEMNHFSGEDGIDREMAEMGYEGKFVEKRESPALRFGAPADGCCVFWSRARFTVAESHVVHFSDAEGRRPHNQRALIVVLRDNGADAAETDARVGAASSADGAGAAAREHEGDRTVSESGVGGTGGAGTVASAAPGAQHLIVATTHLKASASPTFHSRRASQARQLVEALQRLAAEWPGAGVIVCGDLNEAVEAGEGGVIATLTDADNGLGLQDSHPTGRDAAPTVFTYRSVGLLRFTIDFILSSAASLRVRAVLGPANDADVGGKGIPSASYPSDHFLIAAEIDMAPTTSVDPTSA